MTARTSAGSSPSTEAGAAATGARAGAGSVGVLPEGLAFTRYALDRFTVRLAAGRLLLGGAPLRLVRLTPAGASALDTLMGGRPSSGGRGMAPSVSVATGAAVSLARRLVTAGILHPVCDAVSALPDSPTVAVVIPVRNAPASFYALLSGLTVGGLVVHVVDDGSDDGGAATRRLAAETGARWVGRGVAGGPAAARNAGPAVADLLAFLDADTLLDPDDPLGWLRRSAAHFADPAVGAVAPRVRAKPAPPGSPGASVATYEGSESPLDLGAHPGLVGIGRRLSYLPAAAIVVRRTAFEHVGGFDETMRFGEDVDLVRRLERAGWLVRYEPASVVWHAARDSLGDMARQRFHYGTAAAAIHRRHAGSVAPLSSAAVPALSAISATTALAAAASPGASVAVRAASSALVVGTAAITTSRLRSLLSSAGCPRATVEASRLAASSTVSVTGGLLAAIRRVWWPLLLPVLANRRARPSACALLALAHLAGHGRRAGRSASAALAVTAGGRAAAEHLVLGLVDDVSYGAGVWWGCVRERSFGALAPHVTRPRSDLRAR